MSELLPTRQAATLQTAIMDYLTTTFALADADARSALTAFLEHEADGIFKGPYVRTRLPFAPAPAGWHTALDLLPAGFVPYGHQAAAFGRLSSRSRRPLPTLVTTGTGSGKTECFLLPILDHVLRSRREGRTGMKALILYPMNALANDQAGRLASLITATPADGSVNPYAGVTAALYTGEDGPKRTKVTVGGLITAREVIRSSAPDILLTNYKMLDHLLLRADDAAIWQQSADTLQYVVLDEFHTYDGAQGTDVAMLLRRLGLALKSHWPARGSASDVHSEDDWVRPLGKITPVGTSATLGDGGDSASMVGFASEVFGERFEDSCVITESRLSAEAWFADAASPPGLEPITLTSTLVDKVVADLSDILDGGELTRKLLARMYAPTDEAVDVQAVFDDASEEDLLHGTKALPLVRALIEDTRVATSLDDLVVMVLPTGVRGSGPETGAQFISIVVAALSHLRAVLGRIAPSLEVHLWIRELTRIDRLASSAASFYWSDDGALVATPAYEATAGAQVTFPAVYCRHCGRSGWGVELATTGQQLTASDKGIRSNHLARTGRFRALIHAPSEAQRAMDNERVDGLVWFNTQTRDFSTLLPDPDNADYRHGRILPVLMITGPDADDHSRNDTCPSCLQRDGIRFLGSAIATLLSVSLSSLFGSPELDPPEKKALVFTDSVQDAAHRAGFVAARSHTLTMRSVMRDGFADVSSELSLPELTTSVLQRAGDDPFRRYRILPNEFANDERVRPFFQVERQVLVPREIRQKVEGRLRFDLALEFGLNSRLGRTLEATGSLAVQVHVGTPARMAMVARGVTEASDVAGLPGDSLTLTDHVLVQWVRGVAEHMRQQGAIEHEWLGRFLREDGNRWAIWGGRPASQGMPAFPKGRNHPAFPRIGGRKQTDPLLDSVTDTQSWYARWTAKTLEISPQHAARLARGLLDRLAKELLIRTVTTESGGTVYAIPPSHVLIAPTADTDLASGRHLLLCNTCHSPVTGSIEAINQLDGAPCLYVRCPGRLARAAMQPDNFYRRLYASSDMRRVVAREHTGLLDSRTRLEYENGFKRGQSDPSSPNTLVATPTLEMGIDIGDLSAVFLASLPRTVASYLQRIGRAGRETGNALNLAYVTGRGEFLPRLNSPTSLINGVVRPPSIYLSAEEILQRQYVAHLVDAFARDGVDAHHPRTARAAMENASAGSFLGDLIDEAERNAPTHLLGFLAAFGADLRAPASQTLRDWATPRDVPHSSGLARQLFAASQRWASARALLEHRRSAIQQSLPALQQAASVAAASEDDRRSLQTAQAALKLVQKRLGDITGEYWIATLEEFGLLPNYTLLGDSATLDVSVSWFDPEKATFESQATDVQRPTSQALREFAPGATFYAKGLEIRIDAVDLGADADAIRVFALCPDCGYAVDTEETGKPQAVGACPRCGSAGLQDTGQRVPLVELKRASAAIRRDESLIDDRHDERSRTPFTIVAVADIDPAFITRGWYVDSYDFGAKYSTRVTIRWLNFGKRSATASPLDVSGYTIPAPRFRICESCGHLDSSTRANSMDEHRPWCPHRKSPDEHTRPIVLCRTLHTQGVLVPLPWTVTHGDMFALPSLQAALLLGLRDEFGGSPDHIGVALVKDPNPNGPNTEALLLHDTVPGGTGYLADLVDPDDLWHLLRHAYQTVRDCDCRTQGRLACHHCLLPFAAPHDADRVSRQSAERHLRAILAAGQQNAPEPDQTRTWAVTSAAPTSTVSSESHLELRFREAFIRLAKNLGATITEQPGPWGNIIRLHLGNTQWKLEPQVLLGGVRPDFLLTSSTPGPRIAIFTDGYAFHASLAHNRLADDAAKRAMLRLKGDQVLAVTARDLDAFDSAPMRPTPAWFNSDYLPGLKGAYGFSSHVADAALGGPMAILAEWIQQNQQVDFESFARALPIGLPHTRDLMVPERAPLTEIAQTLFKDPDAMAHDGVSNAWWWRQGSLGVLVRRRRGDEAISASGAVLVDIAALLDDQSAAIAAPGFRDDWQTWLEVSNTLLFRTPEQITTIATTHTEATADSTVTAQFTPRRVEVSEQWRKVLDVVLVPAADGLANELSRRGVRAPDWAGEEVGADNIPVDFAWTHERIVVMFEPSETDVRDLEAEGWRVIPADAETIKVALEET